MLSQSRGEGPTVAGKNLALLDIYCTTIIPRVLVYKVMQDFYHQPYHVGGPRDHDIEIRILEIMISGIPLVLILLFMWSWGPLTLWA